MINSSAKFQVFILSHDRPEELRHAVSSWLTQDLSDVELVVSDNSSDERVAMMMAAEFPTVEVRRRYPLLRSTDHFNTVRSEATSPWFMLFHDDDYFLPGAFAAYKSAAEAHPDVAAIAGNAYFVRNGKLTSERVNSGLKSNRFIKNATEIALGYFHPIGNLQPFPAYLYNTRKVMGLSFDFKKARKCSDFIFLTEVAERGRVLWMSDLVMATRIHTRNDSREHDIRAVILARRRLISRNLFLASDRQLELYRMWNYLLHLRQQGFARRPWKARGKNRVILNTTAAFFLKNPRPLIDKILTRIHHGRFSS